MSASNDIKIDISLQSSQALQKLQEFVGAGKAMLGELSKAALEYAGFAAGLFEIIHRVKETEEQIEQLTRLAQELGATVDQMQGLSYVAERADLSLERLAASARTFSKFLINSGEGAKNYNQALLEQADIFSRMPDGPSKTALAVERFGRAGIQMIPILNQGSDALREMMERGKELFGVDEEAVKGSELFKTAMVDLNFELKGMWVTVSKNLAPSFILFTEVLGGLLGVVKSLVQAWAELWQAIGSFSGGGKFEVPKPEKPPEKPKLADDMLTKDQFESQKKSLEQDIKDAQVFMEVAKNPFVGAGEQIAVNNVNLDIQIRKLEKIKELNDKAMIDGLMSKQQNEEQNTNLTLQQKKLVNQKAEQPESIFGNLNLAMAQLEKSWGTFAQQIASTFKSTVNTAINSVSANLTAVIMKTKTWGQALRDIGTTVLNELISSIIKMGVEFVLQHVIMRGAMALTNAIGVALGWTAASQSIAQESAKAPGLAANAATASVSSYGASAVVGMVLAIAAIAAIIGVAMARESGGTVTAGQPYIVGEKRPELFIPQTNGYVYPNVPAPVRSTQASDGGGRQASVTNVQVHNWNDEAAMTKHIRDNPDTHHVILDKMRKNGHIIGARA